MTVEWTHEVEQALHAWVVAGSKLGADKVFWAQQDGPRPAPPCIELRCALLQENGPDWVDVHDAELPAPGAEIGYFVRSHSTARLSIQCWADATDVNGANAVSILRRVIKSGRLPSVRIGLESAKIGLAFADPMQFLGSVTDMVRFEPRAFTQVILHLAGEICEIGTFIETAPLTNCIEEAPLVANPPPVYSERLIHVRPTPTGDDNSKSGSPTEPLATFFELVSRFPDRLYYERWIVDVSGVNEKPGVILEMLTPRSAGPRRLITAASGEHRTDFFRPPIIVRADPELKYTIDQVNLSKVDEATHTMMLVTDSTAPWVVDEHKGRFLLDGGFGATPMPIMSNTADTLVVAGNKTSLVDPVEILDTGATFCFGEDVIGPGEAFFNTCLNLQAECGINFQWINFERPSGNTASTVRGAGSAIGPWGFYGCRIDGGVFAQGGILDFDGCYFNDGFFSLDGLHDQTVNIRFCGFQDVTFGGHSSNYFALYCRMRDCSAFGTNITSQYIGNIDIQNCELIDSTTDGIKLRGSNHHRVQDTIISGVAGDAIDVDGPQRVRLINVQGTGNAGFGLRVRNGAQIDVSGGTGVTSSTPGNDIDAGGALGTKLWADVPFAEHSAATSVRVYT